MGSVKAICVHAEACTPAHTDSDAAARRRLLECSLTTIYTFKAAG